MAGELKEYKVEVNGVETTLLLTDEDAKNRGITSKGSAPSDNKSRTAANKSKS